MNKNKLKTRLPLLNQHKFFLILGNHSDLPTRDKKAKFVNLSDILKEELDLVHSIIITHIDDSLLCQLAVDGGQDDPIKLWSNIIKLSSSNKQSNVFRAWMKIKSLQLRDDNISQFILIFYNCVSELRILEVFIDEENLAYDILAKIPESLGLVRDSIITSGSTSSSPILFEAVLDTLDSYLKSNNNYTTNIQNELGKREELNSATALYNQVCPKGSHNSKAKHTASNCFSLHPELLKEYRKDLKDQLNKAEAHFTRLSIESCEVNLASIDSFKGHEVGAL
ncbi:hypothetical protein BY996DRAFT_6563537 [Phakopsora pachyrhizi]|nr:hypothetical protein BY996DRAFT_6563537 [Phakopsora pachyrhizi]